MNFGEAVNSALIKKYATFKGRACRAEWWYFLLFSFLVIVFAASVAVFFTIDSVDWKYLEKLNPDQATEYFINSDLGKTLSAVSVVLTLALFIPGFAVTVRRVQDLDANYYWSLPYLVAALIGLWEAFFPPVTDSAIRLAALSNLITIVYCLAFLRRGSFDENRFGPDPLEVEEDTY
tara:strand:+ start:8527 stop:9057 length:531 start_codon:yes stop_codon:yes gene_type:complete